MFGTSSPNVVSITHRTITIPVSSKPKIVKKKTRSKTTIEPSTQSSIMTLPYTEGSFRFVQCPRKKATSIQQWLYSVNKNNAAGRVYATRYDYKRGGLMIWRMA